MRNPGAWLNRLLPLSPFSRQNLDSPPLLKLK
jgi:hypothetical protein